MGILYDACVCTSRRRITQSYKQVVNILTDTPMYATIGQQRTPSYKKSLAANQTKYYALFKAEYSGDYSIGGTRKWRNCCNKTEGTFVI